MEPSTCTSRALRAAGCLRDAFASYLLAFDAVTRRAPSRFVRRDWAGMQSDARERLELYGEVVGRLLAELDALLGPCARDEATWGAMRAAFAEQILGHPAVELAETFFNSVTRRVFATVGVNPAIEFVDFRFTRVPVMMADPPTRTYVRHDGTAVAITRLLEDYANGLRWADVARDADVIARCIERQWDAGAAPLPFEEIEVLRPVFYRRKGAYLVGRVRGGERAMPLVLALVHRDDGVAVDAALVTEEDASVVFSFTRSYFHVETRRPADVIAFLRSILPMKAVSELYTAIGHHKHGKTEFWRDLQRHLARTDEVFQRAPGSPGTVMTVFTMPSIDVVFKVIRDTFPVEKRVTRDEVRRRYRFVFTHDRAGRLVDAHEFEHIAFDRRRFSDELLEDLLQTAGRTVRVDGDRVVIAHLYTERRVRPLDLYLRTADPVHAREAVLDYGRALRDLGATDIFPGDFLVKNFGVTRHGRIVFYDYDELCSLAECSFRELPESRDASDDLADEPWFGVGPNDIFPEELARFLPFDGALRDAFLGDHGCLFTPTFWRELQRSAAGGEIPDIYPYREELRFPRPPAPPAASPGAAPRERPPATGIDPRAFPVIVPPVADSPGVAQTL